jgi:hypothetical protein
VGLSAVAKRFCLAAALLLGAVVFVSATPSQARASTDVMFVFDTTGSMGGALNEAAEEIQEAMTQIGASLPDTQFGLAEMRDYSAVNFNGFPTEYELEGSFEEAYDIGSGNQPWTLKLPISANQSAIASALAGLSATGGGDGPESYGRALYETDVNPAVGWRPGARGVIVLVADNLPHDADVNEGIPPEFWASDSPFYTSPDPGIDNTLGTADDLDWQNSVLQRLIVDGKPLEYVDYFGAPEYFPYWQNWTARTGGSALQANGEDLAGQIAALVKAGATAALPPCPTGLIRDASSRCVTPPPPPPPSNNFKIEPRISCAKGCYVVSVKIVFDSAGNVIAESVLDEESARSSTAQVSAVKKGHKKKAKAQIKRLSQAVTPGVNTLRLKLTSSAKKTLKKKGSLKLKVSITFTPTGGSPKSQVHTFKVKAPAKPAKKHRASK